MRRWRRIVLYAAVVLLAPMTLGVVGLYHASQQVPEFYAQALSMPPAAQAEAGDALEREALELNNQVRQSGQWQARFTADQINGWLADDMPEKFPQMLPAGVSAPRVALDEGLAQVACRYRQNGLSTVVVLGIEPFLTEDANTVAIRIRHVRAGQVPIPLGTFMEEIANRAAASGLPLRWSEIEGDPVALVTIPEQIEELKNRRLKFETIAVQPGELVLSGRTEADETTVPAESRPPSENLPPSPDQAAPGSD